MESSIATCTKNPLAASSFRIEEGDEPFFFVISLMLGSQMLHGQGSQFAIACSSQPTGGVCPPATDSSIVDAKDYYDLSIVSVCVNYPDSFWHNKLISLQVTLTYANQAPRSVPIYNSRAQGSCMIGVNGFTLVNSVPFDGNNLTIETEMYRSNSSDGLQKILSFANGTSQQSVFANYASAAVPFLTAATDSINSAINTFGRAQYPWLVGTGITLTAATHGQVQNNDLREEYLVQYQGPSRINNSNIYVDGNDLRWSGNGTLVRDPQSAWIIFRIRKRGSRINMTSSPWYSVWSNALNGVVTGSVDGPNLTKAMQAASAMLLNDSDYTHGDRNALTSNIAEASQQISALLAAQHPSYTAIRTAIGSAQEPEASQTPQPQLATVTPPAAAAPPIALVMPHMAGPAAIGGALRNDLVVTPQRLAQQLRALPAHP